MLPVIEQYFRLEKLPHMWCPGCGNGIVLHCLVKAIDKLCLDQDRTAMVSGIGCAARASGYLDFDTLHTTHGRALAFATGVKFAKPELNVFVLTGDGDCTAIGGNHFIHAARRNINLTTIVFNNNIYGMTGGQYSPMTPNACRATTSPYGNLERPFNLAELAIAAGATFVGRTTTYHTKQLTDLIIEGYKNNGFSLIEVVTHCPTAFGRQNKLGSSADMLKWQRDHGVTAVRYENLSPEERADKFIVGVLHKCEAPEYTAEYQKMQEKFRGRLGLCQEHGR